MYEKDLRGASFFCLFFLDGVAIVKDYIDNHKEFNNPGSGSDTGSSEVFLVLELYVFDLL